MPQRPIKDVFRAFFPYLALLLLVPALTINLGLLTFIDDEAIRALVALEMHLSGNFIIPTLLGEFYYNKPPLYNWILLGFFRLFGHFDEFTARIPTVLFTLAYAGAVWYWFRKHFGQRLAVLNALFLITCGRIFFYDSMLGLIDTFFSFIIFLFFMVVYHLHEQKRWLALFAWAYFLAAAAFLLKGLPALVFLVLTLPGWLIFQGDWRRLFSWQHLVGGAIFLLILGSYYLEYQEYNSLEPVLRTLFTESSKRTVVNYGIGSTLLHLFTFPFEMTYHFLPWSLLILFLFQKGIWKKILADPFLRFLLFAFAINIPVYWTSVEVYPRYLLMFPPLFFGITLFAWRETPDSHPYHRAFMSLFWLLLPLVTLGILSVLFLDRTADTPGLWPKALILFSAFALILAGFVSWKGLRMELVILFLLVFRIGFDWFVLPDRNANDWGDEVRHSAIELGERMQDEQLYIFRDSEIHPASAFYITRSLGRIFYHQYSNFGPGPYYLIQPEKYPGLNYRKVGELKVRHDPARFRDLGIFE